MSGIVGEAGSKSGTIGEHGKTWTLLNDVGAATGANGVTVSLNRNDNKYFLYKVYINQWNMGNFDFFMRIFQDGDSNVKTASNYQYVIRQWAPDHNVHPMHSTGTTSIQLANNSDTTAVQNQWTEISIQAPANSSNYPQGMVFSTYNDDTGDVRHAYGAWMYKSAGALNALQFYSENSNSTYWESAKVYGLPK